MGRYINVTMEKDFKVVDSGDGPIDLRHHKKLVELRPTEFHHKSNGDVNNNPSFCMILEDTSKGGLEVVISGQISLETLAHAMDELGYSLTKKRDNEDQVEGHNLN